MQLNSSRLFIREYFRSFHTTGAILPSGGPLARALIAPLDEYSGPRRILEAGPGTGAVTAHLLGKLRPGDRLTLCELNPAFVEHLQRRIETDPKWSRFQSQIDLVSSDVGEHLTPETYHLVISGLPLNNFQPERVRELIDAFLASLVPGGSHTFFEYQALRALRMRLDPNQAERARLREVDQSVRTGISGYPHHRVRVCRNVPPAWVYVVRRPSS